MTKEDIIRMAREAGFYIDQDWIDHGLPGFERFAELVAAAVYKNEDMFTEAYAGGYAAGVAKEREACAKVCDDWPNGREDVYSIGVAIRARGRKMTDRELMQQALEALEHIIYWDNEKPEWEYAHAAITALRQALGDKHD